MSLLALAVSCILASDALAADTVVKIEDVGSPAESASFRFQDNLTSEFVAIGRVSGGEFTASGMAVETGYTISVSET